MLRLDTIQFRMDGRVLFDGAAATIPDGHRVGVVGRNGTGKTTLFRLIRGELSLDGGEIGTPNGARIGGVAQEAPASDDSLLDTVLAADTERAALLSEAETARTPDRIAEIQERLADIGAHSAEARASSILSGLGFSAQDQRRACHEFSGGWRMRVALAAVLFSEPDLLLLDEPTNYLDLEGTVWLESFLARYPRTALVISHDRGLLNRAVGSILHLRDGKLDYYAVPYDKFEAQRRARLEGQLALKKKQDAQREHIQSFVDRFRYKASKAKQAQARLKMLERMQPIAAISESAVAAIRFPDPEELPPPLIAAEDAAVGYGDATILSRLSFRIDQDDRSALLGANGQGKSTLSKLIGARLDAQSGVVTRSGKLRVGYFAQHQLDELVAGETPVQHIARQRPEEPPAKLRARLGSWGVGADVVENPVERLSGGQKARLLMCLSTLDAPHLLILDEPTNHLDIESRENLAQALAEYQGAVILVSHDPDLVASVADRLWLVKDGGVQSFDGDLEDYKKLLLSERGGAARKAHATQNAAAKPAGRRAAAEKRAQLAPMREEVEACETRIAKLEDMREKVETLLADPALYDDQSGRLEELNRKHGEILAGLNKAETLWEAAAAKLEEAEAALAG
ncbi:MAG: ABC-F family ATP-binding cassette domain-containing protein [Neomegalonema sp.]